MPTQPPEVIQAIEEQRARLQAHEAETMREMARRWIAVEDALKAEMLDLALYLDELKAKGETVSAERLLQMARYRSMVADARAQHEQYSAWAADAMASDQREMVAQGIYDAQQLIEAAGLDARIAAVTFDHINVNAVEFMAGFAGDGTPLYDLLRASYPESVVRLTDNLVKGLAAGKGPRSTAAMMAQDMAGNLDRALLIAITEQNRALRAGSLEQMKQSKVVKGYVRRAQRNAQVCAACLALDGQEQDTDEIFASHPRCHCYAQPLLRFGKTPSFPSGPEWLSKQSDAVQEKVLGPGKFKLFKQGALDWGSVAKVHDDPVWGPTIKQGTVLDLKRNSGTMSVNEMLKKAGSGKITLTPDEVSQVTEYIARVGFDTIENVLIQNKYAGLVVDGKVLRQGEKVSTGVVHYAKHVLLQKEWPKGTSYQQYIADIEKVILDKVSKIVLSLYANSEPQAMIFKEIRDNDYCVIIYRVNRNKWMTGCILKKSDLDEILNTSKEMVWIRK